MIEPIMYFLLGACLSALATIALLPALWRRAVRLTRARLAATLPLTPEEIAAGKDQIRAAHVVEINRAEAHVARTEAAMQALKAEIGGKTIEIQAQKAIVAAKTDVIAALERDLDDKRNTIAGLEATVAGLELERDNLITNLTATRITIQGLEQESSNLRMLSDQRHARIGELETLGERLTARLSESTEGAAGLREELTARTDTLRDTARSLRDAENTLSLAQRRLAAAEGLAEDRQRAIDDLQVERLRLIEETGRLTRERDHEHVERGLLATEIEAHTRRHAEFEAALSAARNQHSEVLRDLTHTVETLRQERHAADAEVAALRAAAKAAREAAESPAATERKARTATRRAARRPPAAEEAAKGEPA